MSWLIPQERISLLDQLHDVLGQIQKNIAEERQLMVDRNYWNGLTDDEYVATRPTARFNRLYNEAFIVIGRIERLTR